MLFILVVPTPDCVQDAIEKKTLLYAPFFLNGLISIVCELPKLDCVFSYLLIYRVDFHFKQIDLLRVTKILHAMRHGRINRTLGS